MHFDLTLDIVDCRSELHKRMLMSLRHQARLRSLGDNASKPQKDEEVICLD